MPGSAATLRLRDALQEFIASATGDGGQMRSAQTGGEEVQLAEQLLERIGGGRQRQDPRATPGGRAAAAAGAPRDGANPLDRAMAAGRALAGGNR